MKQFNSKFFKRNLLNLFLVLNALCFSGEAFSQCTVCATCTTSTNTGCTIAISANNATNYTVNAADKMCVTAGTYTGNITLNGGIIVVAAGANFNPGTFNVNPGTGGTLEVQPGAVSSMPAVTFNTGTAVVFAINNCGTINFHGNILNNGLGLMRINNNGVMTSTGTITFNGTGTPVLCNSDSLTFTGLTLNGLTGVVLVNNGYMNITGTMTQNCSSCAVDICANSFMGITGNWTSNGGGSTNGISSCGRISVGGTSICNACHVTGFMDVCDTTGAAVNNHPHVDVNTGTWDSTVTFCTCGVVSNPVVTVTNGTICAGSCFSLSAMATGGTPPYTYNWSPNVGIGPGPFTACPLTTTNYDLTVTDAANGTATERATVTVNPMPVVSVSPSVPSICNGVSIVLSATGGISYSWMPVTGLSSTTIANPVASPSVTTSYTLTATDANGCTGTTTVTVVVGTAPVVTISHSATVGCDSNTIYLGYGPQSITLTATSGTALSSYQWYWNGIVLPGDTSASLTVNRIGRYNVIVSDTNGCISDSVNTGIVIRIVDVRCGIKLKKVILCHVPPGNHGNPQTLCIAPTAVPAHLSNHPGDCLGPCPVHLRAAGENIDAVEKKEILFNAWPNPFSTQTTVEFFVSGGGNVKLEIFDLKGTLIGKPFEGVVEGDRLYDTVLDGTVLPQGIYIASLTTDEGVTHLKLVITK